MLKNVAFIPAKENSARLKNKNLRRINGKSLVRIISEKAIQAKVFDKIYVDTESKIIFEEVQDLNIDWLVRDPKLSSNRYGANDLLRNEIKSSELSDNYYMLNCCTPLVRAETIKSCVDSFNTSIFDSVITVIRFHGYLWTHGKPEYDIDKLPNSRDLPDRYLENHILYGIKRNSYLKYRRRIGNQVMFFETSVFESFDINTIEDFKIAGVLYDKFQ